MSQLHLTPELERLTTDSKVPVDVEGFENPVQCLRAVEIAAGFIERRGGTVPHGVFAVFSELSIEQQTNLADNLMEQAFDQQGGSDG